MNKRKLKKWVVPSIYILSVTAVVLSITIGASSFRKDYNEDFSYNYVVGAFKNNIATVVQIDNQEIIKPITDESIAISKKFYNKDADEETQENALIYYENTYMQNTGIMYSSENEFETIATLDGTVSDVKKDDILGNVVEIKHSNNLLTIYQSLGTVNVKKGDEVKQGDVIGTSGTNKIDSKNKSLLFEVYNNGNLLDPEKYFEMSVKELNK